MEENKNTRLRQQLLSFVYAFRGIRLFIGKERNARWHLLATVAVAALAIYCRVSLAEAALLCVVTAFVWMSEMVNTCLEKLVDFVSRERLPELGYIKDLAAAAVLVSAIAAALVGLLIFIPRFI